MKQRRKVFHIHLKETGDDKYFGSIRALFDNVPYTDVGIVYSTLVNYFLSTDSTKYENGKCIINKGYLITSEKEIKG